MENIVRRKNLWKSFSSVVYIAGGLPCACDPSQRWVCRTVLPQLGAAGLAGCVSGGGGTNAASSHGLLTAECHLY